MRATLTVGEGRLVVVPAGPGVAVTGSGTASVTLVGTVGDINDLLDGVGGATVSFVAGDAPMELVVMPERAGRQPPLSASV